MQTIAQIRLANLEGLIKEMGTQERVAELGGTSSIYLSQIRNQALDVKTGKPRQMGDKMARKLEIGCKKAPGWMDNYQETMTHAAIETTAAAIAMEERATYAIPLDQVLSKLGEEVSSSVYLNSDLLESALASFSKSPNDAILRGHLLNLIGTKTAGKSKLSSLVESGDFHPPLPTKQKSTT
jgi:hypothetical protein